MDDEQGSFLRTHAEGLLLLVALGILILFVLAGVAFSLDEDAYAAELSRWVGTESVLVGSLSLTEEQAKFFTDLGLDPKYIPYEYAANSWINNEMGGDIDIGMQLAILLGESQGGGNIGTPGALARAKAFDTYMFYRYRIVTHEYESAKWLLEHFKSLHVRDWSPAAAEAILEDYSDYTGHGDGEWGPNGILSSTLKGIIGRIQGHSDPLVRSGNPFDERVTPFLKVEYLNTIGYKSSLSDEDKFTELYGWNHNIEYRNNLIKKAKELNEKLKGITVTPITNVDEFFLNPPAGVKALFVQFLKLPWVGLWPSVLGDPDGIYISPMPGDEWLAYPYKSDFSVTQETHGQSYGDCAIDVSYNGTKTGPVFSPINGKVTAKYTTGPYWVDGVNMGYNTHIEIQNSIWFVELLHGNWTSVEVGDKVSIWQQVGTEASNGYSTGPHTHFSVWKKGSSECVNPKTRINYPPKDKETTFHGR